MVMKFLLLPTCWKFMLIRIPGEGIYSSFFILLNLWCFSTHFPLCLLFRSKHSLCGMKWYLFQGWPQVCPVSPLSLIFEHLQRDYYEGYPLSAKFFIMGGSSQSLSQQDRKDSRKIFSLIIWQSIKGGKQTWSTLLILNPTINPWSKHFS